MAQGVGLSITRPPLTVKSITKNTGSVRLFKGFSQDFEAPEIPPLKVKKKYEPERIISMF